MRTERAPLLGTTMLAAMVATAMATGDSVEAQQADSTRPPDVSGGTGAAAADDRPSLFLVDAETRIGSMGFEFIGGNDLPLDRIRDNIAVRGPGGWRTLRKVFRFLPGVSAPEYTLFSPVVLQRDVARIRNLYRRAGFLGVRVDYDVVLDTRSNRVSLELIVEQGSPLVVDTVTARVVRTLGPDPDEGAMDAVSAADEGPVSLPADLRTEWDRYVRELAGARGNRFGEQERARLESETTTWFLERGYPWARAAVVAADTVDGTVSVRIDVEPDSRTRVEEVVIEGNRRLDRGTLVREIPIRAGDLYDARRVSEGERELFELDLVRRALGDVVGDPATDTTVTVRYRLDEGPLRLIWGRVGWRSESGMAAEAHWTHRDFFGGARSFTVSANGETGWAALEPARGRNLGVSALVRQPYVAHRSLSATVGPFARFRDDFRDESVQFGLESSLIYRVRPLEAVSFQHELSRLRVDDAVQLGPMREIVAQGDSAFAPTFVKNVFRLFGAYGTLDNRLDPRSGFLVEPSVEFSGPGGASDVDFVRAGLRAIAAVPISTGVGLFVRAGGGRLVPFGDSDPQDGAPRTRALVGLRDFMFTVGGTPDVRGWGPGLVGSKVPDVSVGDDGEVRAQRYVPAGGLARLTGSVEFSLPFPGLAREHGTFFFFDSGRVWSPGRRFDPADRELVAEGWRHGIGGGVHFGTIVGPIRVGIGYKVNPTRVDLLGPAEVANALANGTPLETLATDALRRWHLHLSIGRGS